MTQPVLEKLEDLCRTRTYGIKEIGIGAASFMTGVLVGGSNPDLHTAISGGFGAAAFGSMVGIMDGENERYDIGNAALHGAGLSVRGYAAGCVTGSMAKYISTLNF